MDSAASRFFMVLPALVFIGSEAIRTFVRPVYGQARHGWISIVLGWLPNFLAAFGCMTFGLASIILIQAITRTSLTRNAKLLLLSGAGFVTLAGLILHEVFQTGTGLVYDTNDIVATVAGVIAGATLAVVALRGSVKQQADD